MSDVNRRKFLVNLGMLIGASLTPLGMQVLAAAQTYPTEQKRAFLSRQQRAMLAAIADFIIPDTDTPGASKAGVPEFIEHMLLKFLPSQEASQWLQAFNEFDKQAGGFNHLSTEQQLSRVKALDERLGEDDFYSKLKELTIIGYYTSEIGASVELQYDPVPGPYREIPLKDIGRAWS